MPTAFEDMQLPSDLQRFLPYIAVGVLAVVGLLLVMRGVGPGGGAADPGRIDPGSEVRRGGDSGGGGTNRDGGSGRAGESRQVKRSPKAYVTCVERATNTAALEKCQPLLP
jgi:hypothetical protein